MTPKSLRAAFCKAIGVQTLLALPAGVGLCMVASDAVLLLLGERWQQAIPLVQTLALISVFSALTYSSSYLLLALGRVSLQAFLSWLRFGIASISGDSGVSRCWGTGNCEYQAGDYRLGIHALCVPRLALCRVCTVEGFRRACLASTIFYRDYGTFLERISQIRISGLVGSSVPVCSFWCWSLRMLYTCFMEGFWMSAMVAKHTYWSSCT